jgi:hypothetical protein
MQLWQARQKPILHHANINALDGGLCLLMLPRFSRLNRAA